MEIQRCIADSVLNRTTTGHFDLPFATIVSGPIKLASAARLRVTEYKPMIMIAQRPIKIIKHAKKQKRSAKPHNQQNRVAQK